MCNLVSYFVWSRAAHVIVQPLTIILQPFISPGNTWQFVQFKQINIPSCPCEHGGGGRTLTDKQMSQCGPKLQTQFRLLPVAVVVKFVVTGKCNEHPEPCS